MSLFIPDTTQTTYACTCGHSKSFHEHYRLGRDCSAVACGCIEFRVHHQPRARPAIKRLRRRPPQLNLLGRPIGSDVAQ
jgi:hypothetical protein